ncbi:hypothetical protein OPT61_g8593 [Boeremia exigua]|uniref:Uncharacterized protein n=1 Tax=Boeremia exigua TaxID=749465 RepID=A0ACC2HXL4_9PLEO|nr:hypothetical protein OPT61_g8593 [Boeremia exigua]
MQRTMHWFPTGIIGPCQPKSSKWTAVYLVVTGAVFATTGGYDSGLMSGINIMPAYTKFLKLTTATRSLNVSANFIGWGIAALTMGPLVNRIGRKNAVLLSLFMKCFSIGLITGAQNFPMFVTGRILLGFAKGTSGIAASTWLAETLPPKIRGFGLSITFSVYYIGALLAAGVTYRTARIAGDWSWRLPCLLQVVFTFISGFCLFFTPESPRWLAYQDRNADALAVLASVRANGDQTDVGTLEQYEEIIKARNWERECGTTMSWSELVKTSSARRRVFLAVSVAVIAMGSGELALSNKTEPFADIFRGNNIASYFLGDMLTNAGITNRNTQLQINVVMNSWCLICAVVGTFLMDKVGRKTLALYACIGMTAMMFALGGLTKAFSTSTNLSGIYGTVACIFLFMGSYSVGITPVTNLYPAEILSYPIRSNGMALWAGVIACTAIFTTLVFPIALKAISWRLYFIIGAWDLLEWLFVRFLWVETKGLSLEAIDLLFEGARPGDHAHATESGSISVIEGRHAKTDASESVVDLGKTSSNRK